MLLYLFLFKLWWSLLQLSLLLCYYYYYYHCFYWCTVIIITTTAVIVMLLFFVVARICMTALVVSSSSLLLLLLLLLLFVVGGFVCTAGSAVVCDSGRSDGCACWLYGCCWFRCSCDRGRSVAVRVCVCVWGGEWMYEHVCFLVSTVLHPTVHLCYCVIWPYYYCYCWYYYYNYYYYIIFLTGTHMSNFPCKWGQ